MLNIRQLISGKSLDQGLQTLDERYPIATLVLAGSVTVLGYGILGLLPVLTVIGVFKVLGGFASASTFGAWLQLLLWILITAASALLTFTLVRVKTTTPSGLGLKADKAPKFYELLAELGEEYKLPRIDRVVMHEKFSLEFIPVPRLGLPIFTTNVLYLGLPVMQGLSPAQFRGALAQVLGQYSAVANKRTHWIYRWHQFCEQYQRAYRKHHTAIYKPMQLFYRFYIPVLKYCAASILRRDELEADIYMLQLMNDTEAADVILRQEVCQMFLKNKYWPKIYSMLRKNPGSPDYLPHVSMAKVLRNGLTENEFAQTLKELINQDPSWRDTKPGLYARLQNIGQSKLNMPPPVMETAAQRYLGETFGAVVKLLDKQWLAKYSMAPKKSKKTADQPPQIKDEPAAVAASSTVLDQEAMAGKYVVEEIIATSANPSPDRLPNITSDEQATVTVSDRIRLAELKQKSDFAELSDNEEWELAYLTEKLEDKSQAIALYQQVLKKNPNHAKTLFAVGRILLTRSDESGVKALERAMELDKGCIAQGCWMLAKYFKAVGDEGRSKLYLERAAKISVAA